MDVKFELQVGIGEHYRGLEDTDLLEMHHDQGKGDGSAAQEREKWK